MNRRSSFLSCAVVAALLAPGLARAQASHIYVGPHPVCIAAGIPNAWHCPQNWSDQTVPNSGSTVSIGASLVDGQMSGSVQTLTLIGTDFRTQGNLSMISFDWDGGKIGINGTLTVTGNGALRGGTKELGLSTATTTLEIAPFAVVNWTGGDVRFVSGTIDNKGRFNVRTDARLIEAAGVDRFINRSSGTVARTAGANTATFDVPVTNEGGAFDVRTGTLAFGQGGTFDGGTYAAADGTALLFGGEFRFVLSGTLTGEPEGYVGTDSVAANSGGRLTVPVAATLAFGGDVGFQWTSDIILGPGTLTNTGNLTIHGAATKRLSGGTLRNTGNVFWGGDAAVAITNGRIENAGVYDLLSDGLALSAGGGSFSFVNQEGGFLIGLSGTGTALVGIPVTNQPDAVIDVQTGTLEFTQTLDHQAGAAVRGNATIDVPAGTLMTNAGITAPIGSIIAEDQTGRLTWAGSFNPTATALLAIDLDGTTAGDDYDQLVVTGSATLGGKLQLRHGTGFSPSVGTSFTVLTAASVTGTFATVEVPNDYTYSVAYNATSVVATVTAQPTFDIVAVATSPLTVPPGGSVSFNVAISNNTPNPATGDFWFTAQPGGQDLIVSRTVPGNDHVIFPYRQPIPAAMPPGPVTYRLHIGQFPNNSMDFEQFTLEITGGSLAGTGEPEAWAASEAAEWGEGAAPETASAGADLPGVDVLHAAHPNPFRGRVVLRYELPEASAVRLAVYDLLGREVAVLVDKEVEVGRHEAAFDGRGLAAGVYVVQMAAGERAFTRRLTLLR
jgi:hypothetical protein